MEAFRNIFLMMSIISIALVVYYIDISNKQPNPQEIKVGSIVVLGEGGSMRYCNPEDLDEKDIKLWIVKVDITPTCDTINLKASDYITLEGKVSGINTKDINPAPPMHSIMIYPKRVIKLDTLYVDHIIMGSRELYSSK